MDRPYKPQGYSSVSAYVVADGAQDIIDFLIESFDARQTRRSPRLAEVAATAAFLASEKAAITGTFVNVTSGTFSS